MPKGQLFEKEVGLFFGKNSLVFPNKNPAFAGFFFDLEYF